jgi:aromatic ring-opening dioxygenase catalytic subunit (LigB family)
MSMPVRMPVVFIPHGGGPWPFVDTGLPRHEVDELAGYLRSVAAVPPTKPSALLVISGHWEAPRATVMTSAHPPMYYDYSGFPPESYSITWPAPGDPRLALRAQSLLQRGGFNTSLDPQRGFDHGTFIPLKLTYPKADIPAIQLSLIQGLDPAQHVALGRALAPLRDEGIFIVGSGMTFHNLRAFFSGGGAAKPQADAFDAWLRETMTLDASERNRRLTRWTDAPGARIAHPREEHLLPLMVAAGAAGDDSAVLAYSGTMGGLRHSAFHFGAN